MISTSEKSTELANTIPIRNADDATLIKISEDGVLSLSLAEMKTIQTYFRKLDRDPTDLELETLAQTWSEHCKHKTFRAAYEYQETNLDGYPKMADGGKKTYQNLLKETVMKATQELSPSWCLSVFKDNAGVIQFDNDDAVSFKVETHNHPSALEPYGGAGTGIGGVIRDILGCGLGGKPVLNTDVFCFGHMNTDAQILPDGVLHPKVIARGVVRGVRDYGNRMGIPTASGAIYFDPGYIGNPLVFCGTVGLMPKGAVDKHVQTGDLVVAVGGRTGRDGIHGATFSSAPLESGITSNVVQIGHAIMEKKFTDVLLAARDKGLYRSITDCGAGGFSSAVGELGSDTGVKVDLVNAPLKYKGLAPWEIWLSESQERMVLAVPPENWASLKLLFDQEDVESVVLGEFTDDHMLTVEYDKQVVGQLEMSFLHNGLPSMQLQASWNPKEHQAKFKTPASPKASQSDIQNTLIALLSHPVIASKETVIRQYDHEVQGGSVIKPLMGPEFDGPTDACVHRPKLNSWKGIAIGNGLNPELGKWDPYLMAKAAIDEAYRNLLCMGGHLERAAILDNFCWGSAKEELDLGALVRASEGCKEMALAYGLPFISGKDSFNNTWKSADGVLHSIPPTLLVSAMGVIRDVRHCVTPGFKEPGGLIYLIGETGTSMGGSLAAQVWGSLSDRPTDFDPSRVKLLYDKVKTAFRSNLIQSCHDLSEGGMAVAAAEMGFGSNWGCQLTVPDEQKDPSIFLFAETAGRFLVEVDPQDKTQFENLMGEWAVIPLGVVSDQPYILVQRKGSPLISQKVSDLKTIWKKSLSEF
jgi:phosphoribosylformylglycinamidine synthase